MTVQTQFPNPNQSYQNIFVDAGLTPLDFEQFAIYQNPNSNVFMMLEDKLGTRTLSSRSAKNRTVNTAYYQNLYPTQVIDTRSPSSGASATLTLNWTQTDYETFETGAKLKSASGVFANIVSRSAGQVVIAPFGATTFGASDFLASEPVQYFGRVTNDASDSGERQVFVPTTDFNYVPLNRKTWFLGMDEGARVTYLSTGDANGFKYAHIGLKQCTELMMHQYILGQIEGQRLTSADGTVMQGGYKWQIANQGGVDDPFLSTLDETELTNHFNKIHANNGTRGNTLMGVRGYGYASMMQLNVTKQYLVYAGDTNLIGGKEIKGIDVKKYAFNTFNADYYDDVLFKNQSAFPFMSTSALAGRGVNKQSNFCFYFDPSKVQTDGGDVNFMESVYYGPDGVQGMVVQKIDGLTTVDAKISSAPTSGRFRGNYEIWISKMTYLKNPAGASMHYLNS